MVDDEAATGRRTDWWIGAGLTLVAFALIAVRIRERSLWQDELFSVYVGNRPSFGDLWRILHIEQPNMAGHQTLTWLMQRVRDGEGWVRLPSAIGGAIAVGALYLLVRRFASRWAAALAALGLLSSGEFVARAREVRSYALFGAVAVLATWSLAVWLDRAGPQPRHRVEGIAYVVCIWIAFTLQFFALLLIASHAIAVLAARRELLWQWCRRLAAPSLAILVPIVLIVASGDARGNIDWIREPTAREIAGAAAAMMPTEFGKLLLLPVLAVVGLAVFRLRGTLFSAADRPLWPALLLPWAIAPFAATLAVTLTFKPLLIVRYLGFCIPAWAALLAIGLDRLGSGRVRVVGAGVATALIGALAFSWAWRDPGPTSWPAAIPWGFDERAAHRELLARTEPGDAVVYASCAMLTVRAYYLDRYEAGLGGVGSRARLCAEQQQEVLAFATASKAALFHASPATERLITFLEANGVKVDRFEWVRNAPAAMATRGQA